MLGEILMRRCFWTAALVTSLGVATGCSALKPASDTRDAGADVPPDATMTDGADVAPIDTPVVDTAPDVHPADVTSDLSSDACSAPMMSCGGSCIDPRGDPMHCGGCSPCPSVTNGMPACMAGTCGVQCNTGFHECAGVCADNNSTSTCGTSCMPCPTPGHGSPTCTGGVCGVSCPSPYTMCGGNCVNFFNDPANCGGCGTVCPGTMPSCCNGTCVNTSTDAHNCGSCGSDCSSLPATPYCVSGSCGCPGSYTTCGGLCTLLCTNANCAACGNACNLGVGSHCRSVGTGCACS